MEIHLAEDHHKQTMLVHTGRYKSHAVEATASQTVVLCQGAF